MIKMSPPSSNWSSKKLSSNFTPETDSDDSSLISWYQENSSRGVVCVESQWEIILEQDSKIFETLTGL